MAKTKTQIAAPTPVPGLPMHMGRGFLERVVASPVLVDPDRVAEFEGCLAGLIQHERFEELITRNDSIQHDDYWPEEGSWEVRYKPYNVVNGVLQIPVMGALVNRMAYQVGRYATGYTYIERAFERGMADGNVKGIAFIIDSPGGEAAGNFELCDKLYAGRAGKPMRSFVADMAYSGGYSIATSAPEVIVTRSGGTGSVGVVTMHVDMSGMLERMGLKVTFIKAGKYKVDGNRMEPLSESARERIQGRVDKIYGVFTSTVARNRSMGEDAVRKTEALCYDADESVEVKFADRIGAYDDEVLAFEQEVAESTGEFDMTDKTTKPAVTTTAPTQADVDTARQEAITTERKRFATVTTSEHYAGREAAATKMLNDTDLSADQITGILEATPKATAPEKTEGKETTQTNAFKEHMDKNGGTDVGAGDGDEGLTAKDTPEAHAARISAAGRKARGEAPKKKVDA